jgi:signal transduction histidine kinase
VSNGIEALDRLRSERFDLVVLDLMLPGLGGVALCRAIRGASDQAGAARLLPENRDVAVLMLSGARATRWPMSDRVWYRSLYWRVALGLLALLVATLAVQAAVFLWLAARQAERMPGAALSETAEAVAAALGERLDAEPALDVGGWLRDKYGATSARIFVRLPGRAPVANQPGERPPPTLARGDRWRGRGHRFGRGPGGGMIASAPVVLSDGPSEVVAGEVIALLPRPGVVVLREIAPLVLGAGLALALGGTAVAAWIIFGPANRRLRRLEEATLRLGTGDLAARAPAEGGDEIASVAAAFNQMADELAASDRARRQLLADVSHELMTPLTAIRGYAETLMHVQASADLGARSRYAAIIQEEVRRLEALVGDLLDLARLDRDSRDTREPIAASPVRVEDLFARVVDRYRLEADRLGVRLQGSVDADAETVPGELRRLEQALSNLVANALRHTPAGGRIEIGSRSETGVVVLWVRDTGSGIAPAHLPHVFERFYKADEARMGGAAGSGLGLSIVKAVAERYGGRVSVRSEPGVETIFEIKLPM